MANLIQIQNGYKSYGTKSLFENATFSINEGEHVGVIGPNGAGKSTLFKILVGQEELNSGQVTCSGLLKIGYLAQEDDWNTNQSFEEYLTNKCTMPIWEIKKLNLQLNLGITEEQFLAPANTLSGGYRMRSQLLYVLGLEPNLLLLDEPTNYLDLETLLVLENFLIEYKKAFLLISHDREFLRQVTTQTLEVESPNITKFSGGIDKYFEQKEMIKEQIEKQNLSAKAKRDKIIDFVNRFGAKNTKAKQAQSKLKSLEKIKFLETKPLNVSAKIAIPEPIRTSREIIKIEDLSVGYDNLAILKDVQLSLNSGEHIGVVGINGAGKSTLLKAIAKKLIPIKGEISYGHNVTIGYFAQHVTEELNYEDDVFDVFSASAHGLVPKKDILNLAGSLLFSGDDVYKKISVLSGGEKTRVALGKVLLQKAPLLVLDEPTNHLDFDTVEALTQALSKYTGSIIVVSHDRLFIDRVSTKILEIESGKVSFYPGTYSEYLWSLKNGMLSKRELDNLEINPKKSQNKNNSQDKKNDVKKLSRQIRAKIQQINSKKKNIEKEIETYQNSLLEINESLINLKGLDAKSAILKCTDIKQKIEALEDQWVQSEELIENLKNN